MTFNLLIPELGITTNTKDLIINILLEKWPLSIKELHNKAKKHYNYKATYQALFNAVNELQEQQVLTKKEKKYELNMTWIKKLQSFTDKAETNYYAKERTQTHLGIKEQTTTGNIQVLTFENVFDMEKYLYYLLKETLQKITKDNICATIPCEWRPNFYYRTEYNFYRKAKKRGHKFYTLFKKTTTKEQQNQQFYKELGVKTKTTNNIEEHNLLFKDYYIQIHIPEQQQKTIKKYLEQGNNKKLLEEGLEKKETIQLIITKNKHITEQKKNNIIKKVQGRKV